MVEVQVGEHDVGDVVGLHAERLQRVREAAAAVPDVLIDETSLIGPPERIRDRLQAWRDIAANNRVGSLVLTGADAAQA